MSIDGLFLFALIEELSQQITAARISKIYQPLERDILLHLRSRGQNQKLFISAHPTYPRIHLTSEEWANPEVAPMFCMVLRKHLEGGVIERISQVDLDRIIHIDIRSRNELGDLHLRRLIVEIMGKHSNIILVDPETNMIIDSIHHVGPSINQYRVVLPGKTYVAPPAQDKVNPLLTDWETFIKKVDFNRGKLDQQLVQQFEGVSPLLAKEILHRAKLATRENLYQSFQEIMTQIKEKALKPTLMETGTKDYFYLFPLTHIEGKEKQFDGLSRLLDAYFHGRLEREQVKQRAADLIRFLQREKKKNETKLEKLVHTLKENEQAEKYKLYGELLTAYMHQLKQGMTEVTLSNYYDPEGAPVTIPLDPALTPNENAQYYFKKYTKAKNSIQVVQEQIRLAEEEINYLDTLLQQLELASPEDIEEIREELIEGKYLKERSKTEKKEKKRTKPQPERYLSSEGIEILVGKNNKQNDYLTTKLARPNHTWLHTKDIPGSHVLIRATQFGEETLKEAAQLAAYYSKARQSSQVPVDYTLIKHVKKPNGAKPGYVIYDHQKTIYVTPSRELINRLKQVN